MKKREENLSQNEEMHLMKKGQKLVVQIKKKPNGLYHLCHLKASLKTQYQTEPKSPLNHTSKYG